MQMETYINIKLIPQEITDTSQRLHHLTLVNYNTE